MARHKNMSARERLERSAAPNFYFGTLHISETAARRLKFGTLGGIYEIPGKNLSAKRRLGRSAAHNFYVGTPSISPKLIKLES